MNNKDSWKYNTINNEIWLQQIGLERVNVFHWTWEMKKIFLNVLTVSLHMRISSEDRTNLQKDTWRLKQFAQDKTVNEKTRKLALGFLLTQI